MVSGHLNCPRIVFTPLLYEIEQINGETIKVINSKVLGITSVNDVMKILAIFLAVGAIL